MGADISAFEAGVHVCSGPGIGWAVYKEYNDGGKTLAASCKLRIAFRDSAVPARAFRHSSSKKVRPVVSST